MNQQSTTCTRKEYLEKLISFKDTDFIKVITGVRRSGKSVLLKQYMQYLQESGVSEDHILYIDLEAFEYRHIQSSAQLGEFIQQRLPQDQAVNYILIDEIQYVDGWQEVINGLRVSFPCDIVITGSNALIVLANHLR